MIQRLILSLSNIFSKTFLWSFKIIYGSVNHPQRVAVGVDFEKLWNEWFSFFLETLVKIVQVYQYTLCMYVCKIKL